MKLLRIIPFFIALLFLNNNVIAQCNGETPPSDLIGDAPTVCDLQNYCGTTYDFGWGGFNPADHSSSFNGTIENNGWIAFYADGNTASFTINVSNCACTWDCDDWDASGVQVGIYEWGGGSNFVLKSPLHPWTDGMNGGWGEGSATITATGLIDQHIYYLMVDGFGGEQCDYLITIDDGVATNPFTATANDGGDMEMCASNISAVNLAATSENGTYSWTANGTVIGTSSSLSHTPSVTTEYIVTFTSAGTPCNPAGDILKDTVEVVINPGPTPIISGDLEFCSNFSTSLSVANGYNSYLWSTTSSALSITVSSAGTYSITVSDVDGCEGSASVVVVENSNPTITASTNLAEICDGNSINLSSIANGGTPAYASFIWNAGSGQDITTTPNPGAFTAGVATVTYTVTVTDSKGCVANNDIDVTVYENPTPTISGDNSFCENTSIDLDAGTGYSHYEWTGGTTNQTLTIHTGGTYYVTVTDNHTCTGIASIAVTEITAPIVTISGGGTICADGSTADIDIEFEGSANWTWEWTLNTESQGILTSSSNQTIPSSTAGLYEIISITDATGCAGTINGNATIIVNDLPTPSISGELDFCVNSSTTLDAGASYNSYLWTGGATDQTLMVISPGDYSVTVTDANTCSNSISVEILENALPNASAGTDNGICFGESIDINASGSNAIAPASIVSYEWDNSLGFGAIQNVTPSATTTYTVTVIDNNDCENTGSVTITIHELPSAIAETDVAICNGETTTINGNTSSAVSPATIDTYEWSNSINTANQDVTPSSTTAYTLTVTDTYGCKHSNDVTITVNELPTFIHPFTIVEVTNCTTPNGALTVTGENGLAPYIYNINGGSFSSNNSFSNLDSEVYTIGIEDDNHCQNFETVSIPNTLLNITNVTFDPISCYGDTTSIITITASSGPVEYSINNGTNLSATNTFVNNGAGEYSIYIIDQATTCTSSQILNIPQPDSLINIFDVTNILCFGDTTGSLGSNLSGGTLPYTLNWSTLETSNSITDLVADSLYHLNIVDGNSCLLHDSIILTQADKLEVDSVYIQNLLCNGDGNGIIRIGIIGGVDAYHFEWDSSSIHDTAIVNLSGGMYYYSVSDFNNCVLTDSAEIIEPDVIQLTSSFLNTVCENSNGLASINVIGGTLDYQFHWSHDLSLNNDTAIDLSAGSYSVTIEDANACIDSAQFIIEDYSTGTTQILSTPTILCYGDTVGMIVAGITGGTPKYTYQWYKDANLLRDTTRLNLYDTLTNISAGDYTVIISDSLGCISSQTIITINQPDSIIVNYEAISIHCNGEQNGQINTQVTGGQSPYTFLWNNSSSSDTLEHLAAGLYELTLTDLNNCLDTSLSVTIIEPSILEINTNSVVKPTCYDLANGSLDIGIIGGNPNYTYLWSNGETSSQLNELKAGTYHVTITDASNCKINTSFLLSQPSAISITDTVWVENYLGFIDITTAGGTPKYTYSWSNGETSEDIENLGTGNYVLEITDENNCVYSQTYQIEIPLLIPTVITPNNDGKNDTWKMSGISEYPLINIEIFNRWGDLIFSYEGSGLDYSSSINNQWGGSWNGRPLPFGTYVFILNLNNNVEPYNGVITIVR